MSVPYDAVAKFKYEPDPENANDDLYLNVGQIVNVTEVVDDDWLFGSYTDFSGNLVSGYFPKSFVEPKRETIHGETAANAHSLAEETADEKTLEQPDADSVVINEYLEESLEEPTQETIADDVASVNSLPEKTTLASNDSEIKPIEASIVHEDENFKNKLQTFNLGTTPVMPAEKIPEETPVKKAFVVTEHRSSYVPPSLGTSKVTKKEEKKPDFVSGSNNFEPVAEESDSPRMTLKERMMMLQQKQKEEQEALEAALKRKEERKKAKQVQKAKTEDLSLSDANEANVVSNDGDAASAQFDTGASPANEVDHGDPELHENETAGNLRTDEDNDGADSEDNEDDGDEEGEDEEDEEDEEELRKRKLVERIAKFSGGMGMMGMMGMPQLPSKPSKKQTKVRKEKKASVDVAETAETTPQVAIPTLSMLPGGAPPIMGMPMPGMFGNKSVEEETNNAPGEPQESSESADDHVAPNDALEELPHEAHKENQSLVEQPSSSASDDTSLLQEETSSAEISQFQDAVQPPELTATHTPSHPYRQQFATPTMTSAPSAPPVPVVPPTTTAPPVSFENSGPHVQSIAPQIPVLPPSMPRTMDPTVSPAIPPPQPTTQFTQPATTTTSIPPPVPGSAPAIPLPTKTVESLGTAPPVPAPVPRSVPIPTTTPSLPINAPPLPKDLPPPPSRHSTLGHPPPPPPPVSTDTVSETAQDPKLPLEPVIEKQFTRTSLDTVQSNPLAKHEFSGSSDTHALWWTTGSLPPQFKDSETYFEVETTEIKKRGGKSVNYVVYYILDVHLACITLELAYDTTEPERLLFFHESKDKVKSDQETLVAEYKKFGPLAYNSTIKHLNKSYDDNFIEEIYSALPKEVLRPVANKTFGAVVYRNNNGDTKLYDEIRPGDILVIVKSVFESSHGSVEIGFEKPHVALVTKYEPEKNKIKVLENQNGIISQGKYKFHQMKLGKVRVFRIVGRDYVGW